MGVAVFRCAVSAFSSEEVEDDRMSELAEGVVVAADADGAGTACFLITASL